MESPPKAGAASRDDGDPFVVVVVGSTGVGKTKLGVHLAQRLRGEVINADAMQVYRGLDLLTNKATTEERRGVAHHLFDHRDVPPIDAPRATYGVHQWVAEADALIADIHRRGKVPIVVGGTMYYVYSLLVPSLVTQGVPQRAREADGDDQAIEGDQHKQQQQHESSQEDSLEDGERSSSPSTSSSLWDRLHAIDPVMAAKLHPNQKRKLTHYVHMYERTGVKPSSALLDTVPSNGSESPAQLRYTCCVLWLDCDQTVLRERIVRRAHAMMDAKVYDEVRSFCESAGVTIQQLRGQTKGIWQSIGLKDFFPYLDAIEAQQRDETRAAEAPEAVLPECREALIRRTLTYAQQQRRWLMNRMQYNVPLYRLDTSREHQWACDVEQRAERIVCDVQANGCTSEMEPQPMQRPVTQEPLGKWKKYHCETCDRTLNGAHEWAVHLRSNRHHNARRKARKRQQHEQWMQAQGQPQNAKVARRQSKE